MKRPVKELRGFQRINLEPGEKKIITFRLPAEKLAFWDETTHGFVVEPGAYDLMIGAPLPLEFDTVEIRYAQVAAAVPSIIAR